ncbi:MAG: hypothetical protein R3F20_07680 [Planctomycetota bacterium]
MNAPDSPLLAYARRRPLRLAIAFGLLQLGVLGAAAVKTSFRPLTDGTMGPGGTPLELTDEGRAVFGYFTLVVVGVLGVFWFARSAAPKPVLTATALAALGLGAFGATRDGLRFLAVPGIVFALLVLAAEFLGRRRARE